MLVVTSPSPTITITITITMDDSQSFDYNVSILLNSLANSMMEHGCCKRAYDTLMNAAGVSKILLKVNDPEQVTKMSSGKLNQSLQRLQYRTLRLHDRHHRPRHCHPKLFRRVSSLPIKLQLTQLKLIPS
jgi:hypothetical protein